MTLTSITEGSVTITTVHTGDGPWTVTATRPDSTTIPEYTREWTDEMSARLWVNVVRALARTQQALDQPCGCSGLGWICTGERWWPCRTCNVDGLVPHPELVLSE
jgi:hypothetical protein